MSASEVLPGSVFCSAAEAPLGGGLDWRADRLGTRDQRPPSATAGDVLQIAALATPTRGLGHAPNKHLHTDYLHLPARSGHRCSGTREQNALTDTSAAVTTGQGAIKGVFAPVVGQHSSSSRIRGSWLRAVWLTQGRSFTRYQSGICSDNLTHCRHSASDCTSNLRQSPRPPPTSLINLNTKKEE